MFKDPIYFQKNIKVSLQQIGFGQENEAKEFYKEKFVRYPAAGLDPEDSSCYFERSADLLDNQENGPKRLDV